MSGRAVLEHADAVIEVDEAAGLVRTLYGIEGAATLLSGERDQNFRIDAAETRYVLKLSNSLEDARVTDLQTRALEHLASHPVPTPRLIRGRDGALSYRRPIRSGAVCEIRLLSFLEGRPLAGFEAGDRLLAVVGAALAGIDLGLRDFVHPADGHDLLWDLKQAERTLSFVPAIADEGGRSLARAGLALFTEHAVPRLTGLRRQLIHNDLNPHNVLIGADASSVSGVLDLGDAVRSPLVIDVAVAAAYHVRSGATPLAGVGALVSGFHRVLPLQREEIDILHPLIAGRLAMTAAISAWRAERYPANAGYILRNAPAAFGGLSRLMSIPPHAAAAQLRRFAGTD